MHKYKQWQWQWQWQWLMVVVAAALTVCVCAGQSVTVNPLNPGPARLDYGGSAGPTGATGPAGSGYAGCTTDSANGISCTGGFSSGAGSGASGVATFSGGTSGSAQVGVAAVAGTPNKLLLPTATGTSGYVLTTNGANPQQLTWSAAPVVSVFGQTGAVGNLTGDVTTAGSSAATIAANAVTSAKLATVNTRRTCTILVGADNGGALANGDLAQSRWCYIPYAATVVEVIVAGDAGTPNVIVGRNHAGTVTNLVSSALATGSAGALACANTGGTTGLDAATTCGATLQNTAIAAGDWLDLVSGTAGGTAKRLSIAVTYTVN